MGRYQIVEKLQSFLLKSPINSEADAVYLMVEVRKILDHAYNPKTQYNLLRFFADWTVHTEKSRHLEYIAPVIKKIYETIKHTIETKAFPRGDSPVMDFINMEDLRMEMKDLFQKEKLPLELFEKKNWISFVSQLVQVLEDQPIIQPISEVPRLILTPSNPGCILGIMDFANPIVDPDGKSYTFFKFGNVYVV